MKVTHASLVCALVTSACFEPESPDGGTDAGADAARADATQADVPRGVDVPNGPAVDAADPRDVPNPFVGDAGVCPRGTMACGMAGCVDLQSNLAHCGACNNACPAAANSAPTCTVGMCGINCNAGFMLVAGSCVAAPPTPRPLSPQSLSNSSLLRPTLRWNLPAEFDGAVVELCRDRACTMVIETLRAMGTSARPTMPLPARSVVYWRLRGTSGAITSMNYSATWLFHTPTMDNTGAIDTSTGTHVDLNGDGFDDLAVSAPGATVGGVTPVGQIHIFHGSMAGIGAVATRIIDAANPENERQALRTMGLGDVNGDGYGDLAVYNYSATVAGLEEAGFLRIYYGSAMGVGPNPSLSLTGTVAFANIGRSVAPGGDTNLDGYADVLMGTQAAMVIPGFRTGAARIYRGSATGLNPIPAQTLHGTAEHSFFGSNVIGSGDINGDGISDIVVGEEFEGLVNPAGGGQANVYLGGRMGVSETPLVTTTSDQAADYYARTMTITTDLNNDGYSDLVVGAPTSSSTGGPQHGKVYVYRGGPMMNAAPIQVLRGENNLEYNGHLVVSLGDINQDGFGDIAVGAYGATGPHGLSSGAIRVYLGGLSMMLLNPVNVYIGESGDDRLGAMIAAIGDTNGDGNPDLGVGQLEYQMALGVPLVPVVRIYQSSNRALPAAATRMIAGRREDRFGTWLAQ